MYFVFCYSQDSKCTIRIPGGTNGDPVPTLKDQERSRMMRLLPYGMLLLGSAAGLQLGTCAVGRGTTGDVAALPSAARPSAALRGKPTPAFLRLCQKPCCTCVPCWLHTWLRVSLGVYTPRAPKRAAGSPLRLPTHTHRSSQTRSPRPARHTWPALILPHPSLAATCRPRATCTASRPHVGSTLRPHFPSF